MKDWHKIAGEIVYAHVALIPTEAEDDRGSWDIPGSLLALVDAVAKALEEASNPANIAEHDPWMGRLANKIADFSIRIGALEKPELSVSYGPAPGKPVLVNDKWLEDLNNKIAQVHQRLNTLDGARVRLEDVQRGIGDIVTTMEANLNQPHAASVEGRMVNVETRLNAVEAQMKRVQT